MIKINLLPFRTIRKKENIRRQISILFLTLVLVLILLVYYNFILGSKIQEINTKVGSTKTEIAKYAEINKELAEIKTKLDILNKRLDVIKGLEINRYEPVRLLDAMTNLIIPKRMWFVSFSSSGQNVHISGIAIDNQTVADFMTRLEGSGLFRVVNLNTLKKNMGMPKWASFKNFEISCTKNTPKIIEKSGAKNK